MLKKEVLKEIELTILKKSDTVHKASPHNFSGRDSEGTTPYISPINDIKNAKYALASSHFAPDPEGIQRAIYKRFPELNPRGEFMAKKKTKAQKKVKKVMEEFKEGKLDIGKSEKKVKNRKQAIAIALSISGLSKKKKAKRKKKK